MKNVSLKLKGRYHYICSAMKVKITMKNKICNENRIGAFKGYQTWLHLIY